MIPEFEIPLFLQVYNMTQKFKEKNIQESEHFRCQMKKIKREV